ncbi:MAG TPA: hypothetical protein PKD00_03295 [Burkholderiales bacterium]|nr:hypothetical protein [Burkholderiales bacterium]
MNKTVTISFPITYNAEGEERVELFSIIIEIDKTISCKCDWFERLVETAFLSTFGREVYNEITFLLNITPIIIENFKKGIRAEDFLYNNYKKYMNKMTLKFFNKAEYLKREELKNMEKALIIRQLANKNQKISECFYGNNDRAYVTDKHIQDALVYYLNTIKEKLSFEDEILDILYYLNNAKNNELNKVFKEIINTVLEVGHFGIYYWLRDSIINKCVDSLIIKQTDENIKDNIIFLEKIMFKLLEHNDLLLKPLIRHILGTIKKKVSNEYYVNLEKTYYEKVYDRKNIANWL